ncbi:MAG: adenylate/guanylate cyclase domain-containing protein, partial [bacterium]
DISGFTSIAERLDPEEVMRIVNEFFGELLVLVDEYGGTVDKFLGDGMMILFGIPRANPDDPRRALELSLAFIEAVEKFNRKGLVFGSLPLKLELSIGVNTGNVVAGIVGSVLHREFTVLGDAVNLASRLEGIAKSKEIIVGERTYELTKQFFFFLPLGSIRLKGKYEEVKAYKLIGKKSSPEFKAKKPIGRDKELEKIRIFLEKRDRNILFIGSEGSGKSYLLNYSLELAREKGRSYISIFPLPWEKRLHFSGVKSIINYIIPMLSKNKLNTLIRPNNRNFLYLLNDFLETNFPRPDPPPYLTEEEKSKLIFEILYEIIFNFIDKNDLFIAVDGLENLDSGSFGIISKMVETKKGVLL